MPTYDESILTETKKALGIDEDTTVFDSDIRMHINSAIATLTQLGIGPEDGFEIVDKTQAWSELLATDLMLNPVKTYVYLRVKLLFDPPANSWVTVAIKEQLEQLEWRLNIAREDRIPVATPPLPDEEDLWELDGGVI